MGDDGGFQFTVFRGCWAAVGLLRTIETVLAFSSSDYYMHSRTETQGVRHSVCPSNCQLSSPPPTMQPITCLSHYVRSVYAYSMLRKALPDIHVLRHCTVLCNWQCHLFLYLMSPGINSEVNDIILSRLNNGRPTKPTVAHEMFTYLWGSAYFKFNSEYEKNVIWSFIFFTCCFSFTQTKFCANFSSDKSLCKSSKWSLSFVFPHKTLYAFHFSADKFHMPTSPALIVLVLWQKYNSCTNSLRNCRQYIVTSPFWGPNIFFSVRFSNIGSSSSLTVRHRVQHPYKINSNITVR